MCDACDWWYHIKCVDINCSEYVTGFAKINLIGTNIEIHFLFAAESHTHALSQNTKHLRLNGLVCFYRQLFLMLSNHEGVFHGLCGPERALIRLHGVPN